MSNESQVHSSLTARNIRPLKNFNPEHYQSLKKLGIDIGNPAAMMRTMRAAMDSIQPGVTVPSVTTPIQFLQEWLVGFVDIMTAARQIDELIGIKTVASWEDEEVVQGIREFLNGPQLYGDTTNAPRASSNLNFVKRTIVRFEQGMAITRLDEARAARVRFDLASSDRESVSQGLEVVRNQVGFFGFNGGANYTYGFLNDPNLLAYNTVANNGGTPPSTKWADKTFAQIVADILQMTQGLRTQSGNNIDPEKVPMTLALASDVREYLNIINTLGTTSVKKWLADTYPNIRVVSAPELNGANSGANVGYLFVDVFAGTSTDGGQTFDQMVPVKFKLLGVEQRSKGYNEDYTNATAGSMCKRPMFVYRVTGI